MPSPILISISYSPWSEKARWALEHHHVAYEKEPYSPLIGELGLRRRLKKWRGPVSVPVLVTEDSLHTDSIDIARYAEENGTGQNLFGDESVEEWADDAEHALRAGRTYSMPKILADDETCLTFVPKVLRNRLPRNVALALTRKSVAHINSKYQSRSVEEAGNDVRTFFRKLVASDVVERGTILEDFSYADIVAVQVVNIVCPAEKMGGLRYRTAYRKAVFDHDFAKEFPALLNWRDQVIAKYR